MSNCEYLLSNTLKTCQDRGCNCVINTMGLDNLKNCQNDLAKKLKNMCLDDLSNDNCANVKYKVIMRCLDDPNIISAKTPQDAIRASCACVLKNAGADKINACDIKEWRHCLNIEGFEPGTSKSNKLWWIILLVFLAGVLALVLSKK